MRFYRVTSSEGTPLYRATRDEAHAEAKTMDPSKPVYIDQMEVSPDKETLLKILNGGLDEVAEIDSSWTLTKRGGLKEIPTLTLEQQP
jgi:hypothetical protein